MTIFLRLSKRLNASLVHAIISSHNASGKKRFKNLKTAFVTARQPICWLSFDDNSYRFVPIDERLWQKIIGYKRIPQQCIDELVKTILDSQPHIFILIKVHLSDYDCQTLEDRFNAIPKPNCFQDCWVISNIYRIPNYDNRLLVRALPIDSNDQIIKEMEQILKINS